MEMQGIRLLFSLHHSVSRLQSFFFWGGEGGDKMSVYILLNFLKLNFWSNECIAFI